MSKEYKVGDWVIFIDKKYEDVFIYKKIGKIIDIQYNDSKFNPYTVEFIKEIHNYKEAWGSNDRLRGKENHCRYCKKNEIKLVTDYYKFKKWIEK